MDAHGPHTTLNALRQLTGAQRRDLVGFLLRWQASNTTGAGGQDMEPSERDRGAPANTDNAAAGPGLHAVFHSWNQAVQHRRRTRRVGRVVSALCAYRTSCECLDAWADACRRVRAERHRQLAAAKYHARCVLRKAFMLWLRCHWRRVHARQLEQSGVVDSIGRRALMRRAMRRWREEHQYSLHRHTQLTICIRALSIWRTCAAAAVALRDRVRTASFVSSFHVQRRAVRHWRGQARLSRSGRSLCESLDAMARQERAVRCLRMWSATAKEAVAAKRISRLAAQHDRYRRIQGAWRRLFHVTTLQRKARRAIWLAQTRCKAQAFGGWLWVVRRSKLVATVAGRVIADARRGTVSRAFAAWLEVSGDCTLAVTRLENAQRHWRAAALRASVRTWRAVYATAAKRRLAAADVSSNMRSRRIRLLLHGWLRVAAARVLLRRAISSCALEAERQRVRALHRALEIWKALVHTRQSVEEDQVHYMQTQIRLRTERRALRAWRAEMLGRRHDRARVLSHAMAAWHEFARLQLETSQRTASAIQQQRAWRLRRGVSALRAEARRGSARNRRLAAVLQIGTAMSARACQQACKSHLLRTHCRPEVVTVASACVRAVAVGCGSSARHVGSEWQCHSLALDLPEQWSWHSRVCLATTFPSVAAAFVRSSALAARLQSGIASPPRAVHTSRLSLPPAPPVSRPSQAGHGAQPAYIKAALDALESALQSRIRTAPGANIGTAQVVTRASGGAAATKLSSAERRPPLLSKRTPARGRDTWCRDMKSEPREALQGAGRAPPRPLPEWTDGVGGGNRPRSTNPRPAARPKS